MCVDSNKLNNWLSKITNDNSQKEYYLTDIVEIPILPKVIVVVVLR